MKKSRIIRMLSEVIEDKQTGKQFWFDLDLYKHERDWPKPLSTKDICTKMELNTTYEFRSEEALMKRIKRFNNYVDDCKSDRFYQDELVETLNKRFNQCLEKIANT